MDGNRIPSWSVDTDAFRARDPDAFERWSLEQRVNFGLRGSKLSRVILERYWDSLDLDRDRRQYLHFLLWG